MSKRNRTPQEYIERHANDYCGGDQQNAREQAIVKEVVKFLKEGENNGK